MQGFWAIFGWLAFMFGITMIAQAQHIEKIGEKKELRYDLWIAIVTFMPIIYMAATRTDGFGDTAGYRANFMNMPSKLSELNTYLQTVNKDKGFHVLSVFIKSWVGDKSVIYFGILAAIQGWAISLVYRKYSRNYFISVFLFIASADYVGWMYNGIRQFTAVTIIFAGTRFIHEKKYFKALMLILLAATIHQTALLMIPIIIIAQGKAWNKKSLLFVILVILAVLYVDRFTELLNIAVEETQYSNHLQYIAETNDDGTNPIRVLVYSLPAIFAIAARRRIKVKDDSIINMCVNMSVITMGLYLVSMVTSGIMLGRLPIYTSLYSYILLPWLIDESFEKKSATMVFLFMIGFYLVYYYYQMHLGWGLL